MTAKTKPFDVYSSLLSVPFDIAAYCRMHKFSIESVELTRAIQAVHVADTQIMEAQRCHDAAVLRLSAAMESVRAKMVKDPK